MAFSWGPESFKGISECYIGVFRSFKNILVDFKRISGGVSRRFLRFPRVSGGFHAFHGSGGLPEVKRLE